MRQATFFQTREPTQELLPDRNRWHVSSPAGLAKDGEISGVVDLVLRAQAGDLLAERDLVGRYRHRVQGYIRSIIGPHPAVEDVAQQVFIKMFRSLGTLREVESFEPWLFCMARNGARDYLRRAKLRATCSLSDQDWNCLPDKADPLGRSQLVHDVRTAVATLSARDQELIAMVIEGHCQQLIARKQGATVSATKARLRRLRMALRTALEHLWSDKNREDSADQAQGLRPRRQPRKRAAVAAPATEKTVLGRAA